MGRDGSGATGSRPARIRAKAARADGAKAVARRACSGVGGQVIDSTEPQTDIDVRSASIGGVSGGSRRRAASTASGTGSQWNEASGFHSPVHSSSATAAYVPLATSSAIG